MDSTRRRRGAEKEHSARRRMQQAGRLCSPRKRMITAKKFLPPPKPSRWSAEELEKMNAPLSEESRFVGAAHGGRNVFLTGMAGTGKSTLLRQLIAATSHRVDVTAPTGVAALNVSGMTIHRFCGMLLG